MDLFSRMAGDASSPAGPLEVFHAHLLSRGQADWRGLFSGFRRLRAVTYSSSVPAILAVADLFEAVEITFGSERILSRETAALESASTVMGYRFLDAVADEKALIEKFIRPALSRRGVQLLARVREGSLRFRILRKAPSHEKLYLLEGDESWRVIVGSANLSLTALSGRQRETFVCFDGEEAYRAFLEYATRDEEQGDPIDADLLIIERPGEDGERTVVPAETPLDIPQVPAVRVLKAGVTIIEEPRRVQVLAPSAEALRAAAVRHDGSALRYPVFAVLYGRPDGGKTHFTRVLARAMFGVEQMIRGKDFTSTSALGFRAQLGAIPLIIDDVNRDRFSKYVPDLVKFDRDDEERYAPILISTNREVTAISPDLRKRMIVCHIDGARPKGLSVVPAQQALSGIGTALFREFLNRLMPAIPGMLEQIAANPLDPPDLIQAASSRLATLLHEATGAEPVWARPVRFEDIDAMKDRPLLDRLHEIMERSPERLEVDHGSREIRVNFGGDLAEAGRFEKLIPAQALKSRMVDVVTLDMIALEREYGFTPKMRRRSWWGRLLGLKGR